MTVKTLRNAATAVLLTAFASLSPAQDEGAEQAPRQPQAAEMMPLADRAIVNDMVAVDGRIVAVGERGHILVSEDDGESWQQMPSPVRAMLTRVGFVDEQHGWAVGHDGSVLTTDDQGRTWALKHFDSEWGKPFYDALFFSPERGLVAGANGRMLLTDDGGETWQEVEDEVLDTGFNLYDLAELNDGSLVIAGERGFMARSDDEGESWAMIDPPYIGSYFGAMPAGENGAVFFGLEGRVFLARDVGALETRDDPMSYDPFIDESVTDPEKLEQLGWKLYDSPVGESLFGGTRLEDGRFLMVGVDGTIVSAELDDAKIERVDSPTGEPMSDALVVGDELLLSGRTGFYRRERP